MNKVQEALIQKRREARLAREAKQREFHDVPITERMLEVINREYTTDDLKEESRIFHKYKGSIIGWSTISEGYHLGILSLGELQALIHTRVSTGGRLSKPQLSMRGRILRRLAKLKKFPWIRPRFWE